MGEPMMDYVGVTPESSGSFDDVDTSRSEMGSSKVDSIIGVLSINGDVNAETGSAAEFLTRIELDLACTSERLCNLNIFMMHVATKETELEVVDSGKEEEQCHLVEKTLEFDLLSSFLESELRELDAVMASLKREILDSHQVITPNEHPGTSYSAIEEKLCDLEKTLEQLQEQLDELHEQSALFQKTLSCFYGEYTGDREKEVALTENEESLDLSTKTKLQTAEQQRSFLRMLEKSLGRELDLEKKVTESNHIEEELTSRLQSTQQEVLYLEEEMFDTLGRLFQADNSAETLSGISKELLGRLQISQFNLNSSSQREADLRLKFEESEKKLTIANSEVSTLSGTVNTLERQLRKIESQITSVKACKADMENAFGDLREKLLKEESRAESAEAQCKLLEDKTSELNKELGRFKARGVTADKVDSLERRLREMDNLLLHAVASAEASEEKQKMLYSAIKDMEHIIEDLKLKVGKSELRADSAEDNCIRLSEANVDLNEELSFLRGKLECLESSLHQAEDIKLATAKDIHIRTNVMANLVMQLAFERERLHKQISSLAKDNKILVVKLHQTSKENTALKSHDNGRNGGETPSPSNEFSSATSVRDHNEKESGFSAKLEKISMAAPTAIGNPVPADFTSQVEGSRRIDAGMLSLKHYFAIAALILLVAAAAAASKQLF